MLSGTRRIAINLLKFLQVFLEGFDLLSFESFQHPSSVDRTRISGVIFADNRGQMGRANAPPTPLNATRIRPGGRALGGGLNYSERGSRNLFQAKSNLEHGGSLIIDVIFWLNSGQTLDCFSRPVFSDGTFARC